MRLNPRPPKQPHHASPLGGWYLAAEAGLRLAGLQMISCTAHLRLATCSSCLPARTARYPTSTDGRAAMRRHPQWLHARAQARKGFCFFARVFQLKWCSGFRVPDSELCFREIVTPDFSTELLVDVASIVCLFVCLAGYVCVFKSP
jgi:hypothetical protein